MCMLKCIVGGTVLQCQPPVCLNGLVLAVEPEDLSAPRGRPGQPQQQANSGGLSGPVRSQVANDLALGDLEVEAEQGIAGAVSLGQALSADGRSAHEINFLSQQHWVTNLISQL